MSEFFPPSTSGGNDPRLPNPGASGTVPTSDGSGNYVLATPSGGGGGGGASPFDTGLVLSGITTYSMLLSNDGSTLYVTASDNTSQHDKILKIDTATGNITTLDLGTIVFQSFPAPMFLHSNTLYVLCGTTSFKIDTTAQTFTTGTLTLRPRSTTCGDISPDGSLIIYGDSRTPNLLVVNTSDLSTSTVTPTGGGDGGNITSVGFADGDNVSIWVGYSGGNGNIDEFSVDGVWQGNQATFDSVTKIRSTFNGGPYVLSLVNFFYKGNYTVDTGSPDSLWFSDFDIVSDSVSGWDNIVIFKSGNNDYSQAWLIPTNGDNPPLSRCGLPYGSTAFCLVRDTSAQVPTSVYCLQNTLNGTSSRIVRVPLTFAEPDGQADSSYSGSVTVGIGRGTVTLSTADIALTLPDAIVHNGDTIILHRTDNTSHNCKIIGVNGQLINNVSEYYLNTQDQIITLVAMNGNWWVTSAIGGYPVLSVSADVTLLINGPYLIEVDANSNDVKLTLPPTDGSVVVPTGQKYHIKRMDNSSHTLTLSTPFGDPSLIDGNAQKQLVGSGNQYIGFAVYYNGGTNWSTY